MQRRAQTSADVIVVGAGASGLYAALCAAREGALVTLVSATELAQSSSYWAQGGLAASLAEGDDPERHLADTVAAGRGAVRVSTARTICSEAPAAVADLQALGVRFDADRRGQLALGLEGGHSVRRVVHAGGSATGRRITRTLSALVAEHERIDLRERTRAIAIATGDGERCTGVRCNDGSEIGARAVVLATGGAASLWERSTNPSGATGGGLLLAHRAGAELADLELVQFHPTALALPGPHDGFLVSEAVRGEGALLIDAQGERFVDELAPRDEVAMAIERRLRDAGDAVGTRGVRLDMRDVDPGMFPNIVEELRAAGIDPAREPVPVAPAAHYMMGGIATDGRGRSTLAGLYAIGECACSGLHGANRLASNSLMECFVLGRRAAHAALSEPGAERGHRGAGADPSAAPDASPPGAAPSGRPPPLQTSTRAALWRHAGIERDGSELRALLDDRYPLARLIAASALAREESRGAHFRRDHPATDPELDGHHTVVRADAAPALERWS